MHRMIENKPDSKPTSDNRQYVNCACGVTVQPTANYSIEILRKAFCLCEPATIAGPLGIDPRGKYVTVALDITQDNPHTPYQPPADIDPHPLMDKLNEV